MSLQEQIGEVVNLTVSREASFGYFLTDGTEDVLLHTNEADREYSVDEKVQVFLYTDNQGRVASTTTIPVVSVGKYNWVKVVDIKPGIGVFLDIGINKHLLLGEEDLPTHRSVWPQIGDLLYITIRINRNHRLYAKLATDPIMEELSIEATSKDYNKNIQGHIYRTAKVGSWIFTAEGYKGFIHESQRLEEPRLGEKIEGRIVDVKVDGTVNVSLLPRKQEALDEDSEGVYQYLLSRNGAMPYGDKSMPEDILERFQLSKGAFKRALGKLMKEGKIYQEEGWTYVKKD
ncbi:S1-like domain-containing RNA-binding protein [Cytobacillus spongiae]|uniref:CvfB family protein n=1 Tax=Cytobacillus spongiae TaxID=2901381 RepID=UPI001F218325|nr:S1-like domain-containing RNA-binding protein [Cytobacillus spongiae]UII56969.1 S1-like domain-containing RNA-binding protein [Cytobacillus spongiae]